jgi:CO/xanthine dehydrogenase FAD-binding subunit
MSLAIEMPVRLAEAVSLLAAEPDRLVVAGGTDVVPALTAGRLHARRVLSLARLAEIDGAGRTDAGGLWIGARLTCASAQALAEVFPAFARAAAFGVPGVRGVATVGGNVVSAAGGDLLPLLVAAQAEVVLESVGGTRHAPMETFLGAGRADVRPGELVAGILIPTLPADAGTARLVIPGYGTRAHLALALARDAHQPRIRVAVQQGNGVPIRVRAAEAMLAGELARAGRAVSSAVAEQFARTVGDTCPDPYSRSAATVLAGRLLDGLLVA